MEDMSIYVSDGYEGDTVSRKESLVGLSYLDFEPGDNFYWIPPFSGAEFGTVISSEEGKIVVLADESGERIEFVDTPERSLEHQLQVCGKPMDYSGLRVGSIISQMLTDNIRRYVRVTEYVPGLTLKGDYSNTDYGKLKVKASRKMPVEHLLADWELED